MEWSLVRESGREKGERSSQKSKHMVLIDCQASIFPQAIKMEHMSEAASDNVHKHIMLNHSKVSLLSSL